MLTPLLAIYVLLFFILIWFYSLYILFLEGFKDKIPSAHTTDKVHVSILIPFFNERDFVERKVHDLEQLDLSGLHFEIIFIDGGSNDKSAEALEALINTKHNWKLLRSPARGKIHQLNHALASLDSLTDIVINTDMDTIIDPGSVRELVHVLAAKEVAVAGACVVPGQTIELDKLFWEDQNFVRFQESHFHSSSTVVAPLYAFKKRLLASFPDDCIADDVYVSFLANEKGSRSIYSEKAKATEIRGSSGFTEFIRHKYRKGIANLRETFRFLKTLSGTHVHWKFLFLNRFAQLCFLPIIFFVFASLTVYFLFSGDQVERGTVIACVVSGLILAEAAMKVKKRYSKSRGNTLYSLINLALSNMVLVFVIITYPFVKHDSQYRKTN